MGWGVFFRKTSSQNPLRWEYNGLNSVIIDLQFHRNGFFKQFHHCSFNSRWTLHGSWKRLIWELQASHCCSHHISIALIRHVNEYPTKHCFGNPRHTQSMIAYVWFWRSIFGNSSENLYWVNVAWGWATIACYMEKISTIEAMAYSLKAACSSLITVVED